MQQSAITHTTVAASECIIDRLDPNSELCLVGIEGYGFNGWFGGIRAFVGDLINTYQLIKSESPDVVLSVMHYASVLSAVVGLLPGSNGIKKVSSLRGPAHEHLQRYERGFFRGRFIRLMISAMAKLSDRILVPSAGTRQELIDCFHADSAKVHVIPNGIDGALVEKEQDVPIDADWIFSEPSIPVVCAAARLSREKNIAVLLGAFSLLLERKQCRFLVLGDGPERASLEQLTRDLGIEEQVTFLGYRENVFPYIERSSVFLHSCLYEGFGYSIIEAMACGTPVIATDCPYGPREIIGDDQYGLLCSMNDEQELADKIYQLLNDENLHQHYREAGKQRARDLSVEKMIAGYGQVFEQISEELK